MKKTKTVLFAAFVLCLIAACATFFAGCGVKIEGFEDKTEEVSFGSVYALDLDPVTDGKGNVYEVTATVKNAAGGRVAVFGDTFDVADLGGYTIVYAARSGGEIVAERTVTLTVKRDVAPTLYFSDYAAQNSFETNREFRLPTYVAYSPLTGEVQVDAALFYTEGGAESERQTENGAFIPAEAGSYVYRLRATDGLGHETSISYEFSIKTAPAAEEIESFADERSLANVKMTMGETSSLRYWAEEVGGVTGSIRFDMADQWPQLLVRPRQELKTAEGYNWISFKLYLDPTGLDDAHRHKLITNTLNGRTNDVMLTAGRWTEVYLDAATFLSSVDEEGFGILGGFLNDNATDRLGEFRAYSPFTCYLADVRMVKANAPEEDQLLDFSQSGALLHVYSRGAKNWNYGFNLSVTEEAIGGREGAKLAMEAVNPACGYPALFVDPAYDLAYYTEKGYTHIKASLYIDGATLTTGTSKTAIFFLNGQHQFQENIPADEWVEVQIPIENFFDNVNGEGFAALFNFVNEGAAQDAAMTVYLGGIEAVKPAGNVIYSPSAVNVFTQDATYAVYDGDVGGVKNPIEFTVGTGGQADIQIFVTPLLDKEYCVQQGFTHVKMRVYIDSETLTEASRATGGKAMLILPNSAGENCELVQIPLDCWYEMVFTVEDFYADRMQDGWLPLFTFYNFDYSDNGAQVYFADEGFKIYLDTVSAFTPEQ